MKSCTVGFSEDFLFPAFIREIIVFRWFFHWCFRMALRKLALAEFLEDPWDLITIPQIEQVPFTGLT